MRNKIDASPELDAILGEPITDADRLAEYLKRRAAEQPKQDKELVFGDFSFDSDFEVPLIKKPQQSKQTQELGTQKQNNLQPENVSASDAPAAVVYDPIPAPKSPKRVSISPSRRSGSKVPDSDRLRRVAIRRRSQSCGRRQLLKEFDNLMNETGKSSSTFFPPMSSTPCEHKKQSQTVQQEPQNELQIENVSAPENPAQIHLVVQSNCARDNILESLAQYREQVEATFQRTFNMDCSRGCAHPSTPQSVANRQTFTIEKKGNQSQSLLVPSNEAADPLTPKSAKQNSKRVPLVRLRRISKDIEVPDTPPVPAPRRREPQTLTQPEEEIIVPETQSHQLSMNYSQSQKVGEIIHNISRNASIPMVVIPVKPNSPTTVKVEQNTCNIPEAEPEPAVVVSRSMQTSSPKMVKNVEIMTDDESGNESDESTAPLNLAPPGGNTTRLQRLRKRQHLKSAENQENSIQLLNLHRTNPDNRNQKTTLTSVLNKAPSAPINGEKFAEELVRMSNYEILDLRKRNSMGLIYPLNAHRTRSAQQQQELEENIQLEILRRNQGANEIESLPNNSRNDEEMPCMISITKRPSAPVLIRETSRRPSRSRSRRHEPPITKELANYIAVEKTLQQRRNSRKSSKRSLYTKGDSETEDSNLSSPEKQQRMSLSCKDAVTAPLYENFPIVPPPPPSLRFSQSLSEASRSTVQATKKQLNMEDIVVSRPPPEEFEDQFMSTNRMHDHEQSLGRTLVASSQEILSHNQTGEINQSVKLLDKKAMKPTKPSRSKSQSNSDTSKTVQELDALDFIEALPPPADFDDPLGETSSQRQISELHSNQPQEKENLQTPCLSTSSRAKNLEIIDASKENHYSSFVRVKSLDELTEQLPNGSDDETSRNNQMASKKKKRVSRSKSSNKKNVSKSSSNEQETPNSHPPMDTSAASNQALDNDDLDDQPSTSQAAREALERSTRKREKQAKSTSKDDAVVFKKPLAPAPRAKRNTTKLDRQLAKLKITTPLNGTIMEVDPQYETDQQDTTIRRSKRGQVPLRNTWCHTIKDLTKLDFVRNSIQTYKKPVTKPRKSSKTKDRTQIPVSNTVVSRPPLCASTPYSVEPPEMIRRSRHQLVDAPPSPMCSSIGVDPFSDQEDNPPELPSTSILNIEENGGKGRFSGQKHVEFEPANASVAKNREARTEKVEASTQWELKTVVPCAIPDISNTGQASSQFTSWIHGSEQMDLSNQLGTVENHASIVKDLVFKNLEGIDYAFYNTIEKTSLGYMRFKPYQKRDKKRSKTNTMKFIVQYGQFSMEVTLSDANESETIVLRHGDMLEIENGTYYSITNMLDKVGVLMFIRV